MRVLFLTLYPQQAASPRYRVGQFLAYLRAQGVECHVAAPIAEGPWRRLYGAGTRRAAMAYHALETLGRVRQLLGAGAYDVVFLQKACMSAYLRGMPALLGRFKAPLVYDLDDAVHLAPPHPLGFPWRLAEDRGQIEKVFRRASLVLAGNDWLAEAARAAGARTELFPTVVDTDRFSPGPAADSGYRVGWMGTPSTTPALSVAGEALAELGAGELILVGADPGRVHWPHASVRPWSLEDEVEELRGFTVGIMPLEKNPWTRGKCALKALLYMACGVPCVATPFGAVCGIIRHGENGLLADSPAEWREALEQLRDPALRRRLGEAGRATVEEHFSLRAAAPRLLGLLEELT